MLIWGPFLLTIYLAATFVTGAWILRSLLGARDVSGLHIPTSLMLGLLASFLVFVLTSLISPTGAIYMSIAVPVLAGSGVFLVDRAILRGVLPKNRRSWLFTVGITWILLLTQYGVECFGLLASVARGQGVIYQDVIYHGGIARSLALFGFPAQNLQYSGEYIGYHILSHFIAAQISTMLKTSLQVTYTFLVTPISYLLLVSSLYSFIDVISGKNRIHIVVRSIIIYASVLSIFLLSGTPDPSVPIYLSHSYQLQIASLGIIFAYLYKLYDGTIYISTKSVVLISLLLVLSSLIKGSSVPLIIVAFSTWIALEMVSRRKINRGHIAMFLALIAASGVVYVVFFYLPGYSTSPYDIDLHIGRVFRMDIVREAMEVMGGHWIIVSAVAVISVVSYRLVLVHPPFSSYDGAVGTAFLAGVAMYLFMRYGANYYVLAIVCVTNVYCLTRIALEWTRLKWAVKAAAVSAVLLSLYPVSGGGTPSAYVMLSRKADTYFPLTHEKRRLYEELESVSERESLIFTTSLAGAPTGVADNYYPAALSGRRFYLGGHRLKTQAFPGLQERREFVRKFTPASPEDHRRLKELGVDVVLIETADLDSTERRGTLDAIEASPLYRVVFQNEAGVLLAPK